ncbi:hypothetical protein NFHSH190041_03920 [Shewanella sp. NFH-SH190041]|uniref:uroporphyrinogen-III C-methyltransferase n=1 Tax=Shewanella sp. NFH-SH190041 TaxID=2950245 RepID=UPI0021C40A75|nr:uroporphyrinogen-III C-methyltransferase [Shewanella sp. NFH-SH190041]BDM62940.1 hypothetical protein NFHSH190041_03920 [Shewanella sp. NFH-SH190041]
MDNNTPKPEAPAVPAKGSSTKNATSSSSATPAKSATSATVKTKAPSHKAAGHPLLTTLTLLGLAGSIAALGGSYYLYNQQQLQQQEINRQQQLAHDELSQALSQPTQELNALQQQQTHFSDSLKQLEALPAQQQALSERVASLAERTPDHWLIAEADYLVRMAGRKLWLEQDPVTAVGLLKAADERIAAMQDPALLPVRKALAKDIAAVSAIKGVDIPGTVFALDAIINRLDNLPLNHAQPQQDNAADKEKLSDSVSDWRSNLSKTWHALTEDFIVVRDNSAGLTPLLSPEQKWYLVENIRGKLLQAQLALYRHDEINYRHSLEMARDWIQQYFNLSDAGVSDTIKALNALMTLKLDDIDVTAFQSAKLLKQLLNQDNLQQGSAEAKQ